jgi:hypothetical protein
MRVDKIDNMRNAGLTNRYSVGVIVRGVPLKDNNEPFKGAECSITIDYLELAMAYESNSEVAYSGYLRDALGRFVDRKEGLLVPLE